MKAVKILFGLLFSFTVLNGVKSDCNYYQILEPGQTYYIYSPRYPSLYPNQTHCTWLTNSIYIVKINCNITIPPSSGCSLDSLSITFEHKKEQKYCGYGSITSEGQNPIINFNSVWNSPGGSFLCSIRSDKPFDKYDCKCGWKNPTKIVGGGETGINEYPMMAGLVDTKEKIIYCGATIISEWHVITAAHCLTKRNKNEIAVIVGEHDVNTGADTNATELYRISEYMIHPNYNEQTMSNDIAVCKIIGTIVYSARIGPVCLPFQHRCDSFGGNFVTILGWGTLEFGGAKSDTLQGVNVSVIGLDICELYYGNAITKDNLCTYSKGKDSCQMDSGGPVLWQDPTTCNLVLTGITSGGTGCGGKAPAIQTRTGAYIDWIQSVTPGVQYCKVE